MLDLVSVPANAGALIPLTSERDLLQQDLEAGRAKSTRDAYARDGAGRAGV
jgi:hypothetical protein